MQSTYIDDDLYRLLGVHSGASDEEIRLAYRKLAMEWHPDRNMSAHAEETFKRISHAYGILSDSSRRAAYERSSARHPKRGHQFHEPPPTRPEPSPPAARSGPPPASAPNLTRRTTITLYEQVHGCRAKLKVSRTEYCRPCKGSGESNVPPVNCGTCRGSGYVRHSMGIFAFFGGAPAACDDCGGNGKTKPKCVACEGTGVVARKTGHLRFQIPAGIRPEANLRVRGQGRRGRIGEAAGDLLVRVSIDAHPLFETDFPHLRYEMPLSVFRAAAGGELELPTLDSAVSVPLPAALADGTELRIAGHGMRDGATGQRGDLVVRLRLVRPKALTAKQREMLAELDRSIANEPAHADWARRLRAAERVKQKTDREN